MIYKNLIHHYIFMSLLQIKIPNHAIKNDTIGIGSGSSTICGASIVNNLPLKPPIMYTNGTNSGLNNPELPR